MNDILERIYRSKARVLADDEAREPYAVLCRRAQERRGDRRGFLAAVRSADGPAIIGEVKRASPSAGLIARNFEPSVIAQTYDRAGIDCISVLTESDHFLGELGYLDAVRAATRRPILRKDFLTAPYQIAQSAAYGADAVLLIVAGLSDQQLRDNMLEAARYDLDVLVEVHDIVELERALSAGALLVGINNRNLRTFETDLSVSEYILPHVPAGVTVISESGVHDPGDIVRLHAAGARGLLIGESLMRAEDPAALVRSFRAATRSGVLR